jgi:hypothetical protein
MDRHKVGTEIAQRAVQIIARDGHASALSLSLDIPCELRTAGRIVAMLKDNGYVKRGYGICHKDSATPKESTTSKDSATSEHSATKIRPHRAECGRMFEDSATSKDSATSCFQQDRPKGVNFVDSTVHDIRPSQHLSSVLTVPQNEDGLGMGVEEEAPLLDADLASMGCEPDPMADRAIAGPARHQESDDTAPLSLSLRGAEDDEQQPWEPDEFEQAHLDYQDWLSLQHKTKEITGVCEAGAQHRIGCADDPNLAAYHADLDKLISVLKSEREDWKLYNRQLGKARGESKITRSELHTRKKGHSELLRVMVGLIEDRESGELRYANLQAAGETLDIAWYGWRQKMAMDPEEVQHYRDLMAQGSREARKAAWEAKRLAALDLQDELQDTKPIDAPTTDPLMDYSDPEWDAALKEPIIHLDMAGLNAEEDQKQQAERAAQQAKREAKHAANRARIDRQMAEEAATTVEVPASPAPALEAATEPAAPLRATPELSVEQRILAMLAAAAVNGRSVSLVTFRRDLADMGSRDEITGQLNLLVRAKKITEEGQENGRSYRLPPPRRLGGALDG